MAVSLTALASAMASLSKSLFAILFVFCPQIIFVGSTLIDD
jgi:hypothetical protein